MEIHNFLFDRESCANDFKICMHRPAGSAIPYPARYMYIQTTKPKREFTISVECFVQSTKKDPFQKKQFHKVLKQGHGDPLSIYSMYLVHRHFTLGLILVDQGCYHRIRVHGNDVPLVLFVCTERKRERYMECANRSLALVNLEKITDDFVRREVKRKEPASGILQPGDIYFFYAVSHCLFTLEKITSDEAAAAAVEHLVEDDTIPNLLRVVANEVYAGSQKKVERAVNRIRECETRVAAEQSPEHQETDVHAFYAQIIDDFADEVAAMASEVADKDEKIDQLEKSLADVKAAAAKEIAELRAQIDSKEKRIEELEKKLADQGEGSGR